MYCRRGCNHSFGLLIPLVCIYKNELCNSFAFLLLIYTSTSGEYIKFIWQQNDSFIKDQPEKFKYIRDHIKPPSPSLVVVVVILVSRPGPGL